MAPRDRWNAVRWSQSNVGHYESWFVRANDPERARALWIRYTIFSPKGRPQDAVGELWAMAFDRDAGRIVAAKSSVPAAQCRFSDSATDVSIGEANLTADRLHGQARMKDAQLAWDLRCACTEPPLLLFSERLYATPLPKAKVVVPQPNARFDGTLDVDGESWSIDGWIGSQNHNWGSKHTDYYAWGQVAGFDDAPGVFFECATARLKVGPLWTPPLSVAVLRLPDAEIRLNGVRQAIRARGRIDGLTWTLESTCKDIVLRSTISAPRDAFVGLNYANPPGGAKTCLNTKLARCELFLRRAGHPDLQLSTTSRAAFEILTDDPDPAIPVVA